MRIRLPILIWIVLAVVRGAAAAPIDAEWRWTRFGRESGLPDEAINDVVVASDGTPWALTPRGAAWYDGLRWHTVDCPSLSAIRYHAGSIHCGPNGTIFVLVSGGIIGGGRDGLRPIAPAGHGFTSVAPSLDGSLLAVQHGELIRLDANGLRVDLNLPRVPEGTARRIWTDTRDHFLLDVGPGLHRLTNDGWQPITDAPINRLAIGRADGAEIIAVTVHEELLTWRHDEAPTAQPMDDIDTVGVAHLTVVGAEQLVLIRGRSRVQLRRDGQWESLRSPAEPLLEPNSIAGTADGHVWIATDFGLYRWLLQPGPWRRLAKLDSSVNVLARDDDGSLLVGASDGLFRVRAPDEIDAIGPPGLTAVTGITLDKQHRLWVTSGSAFTGAWCRESSVWRHVPAAPELGPTYVHRVALDTDGAPWFLGLGPDPHDPRLEPGPMRYQNGQLVPTSARHHLPSGRTYAMAETADGRTRWFATAGGLTREHDGVWTTWSVHTGLRASRVFSLALDGDDRVWFGHEHLKAGLGTIDAGDRVRYLPNVTGMVGARVNEIRTAPNGSIWLTTTHGVGHLVDGQLVHLGRETGLPLSWLWPLLPESDSLLVGAQAGRVYQLDLDSLRTPPPVVTIRAPRVTDNHAFLRWDTLAHDGRPGPAAVSTRSRIDDGLWSPWSKVRERTLTRLTSGRHIFAVQTRGQLGARSEPTRMAFVMPVPWYQRTEAIGSLSLAFIVFLAIAALSLRHRVEQHHRLTRSERRYRSLIENAPLGIYELDLAGRLLSINTAGLGMLDISSHDVMVGRAMSDVLNKTDHDALRRALAAARQGGPAFFETTTAIPQRPHLTTTFVPLRSEDGRVVRIMGITEDITERSQAETRRRLMMKELDHRVKNNLAAVLGLFEQTSRTASSFDEFRAAFAGRIVAMSRTHEALANNQWTGADLCSAVESSLRPFVDPSGEEPIHFGGEVVTLSSRVASPLGLALHEMATNAAKYGALAQAGGLISIDWTRHNGTVQLKWTESSARAVTPPKTEGVGLSLVRGLIESEIGGRLEICFDPGGVRYDLEFPVI